MTFPLTVLPIVVEIFVSGAWLDITSKVMTRDDGSVLITRGRANEATQVEPASLQLTLNNRDGAFSPRNPSSPYYGVIGRNTPIRVSVIDASYAYISQQTGATIGTCSFSTPDSVATSITGDIDIRFDADLVSWRDDMTLYGKWTKAGSQAAYELDIRFGGTLQFFWTTDGVTRLSAASTVKIPITNGRLAVRVTLDVNNGAGGRTITFYTADTLAGSWTQLGDPVVQAGTTSIINTTSPSYVLDPPDDDFGSVIHGRVYGAQVSSDLTGATVVANPDFTGLAEGATSFVDGHSNTWSLNSSLGSLAVTKRDPRFYGEVSAWPQMWDVTGKDVWVPLEAYDVLRRVNQGAAPLDSPMRAAISGVGSALVAYWPCEEGTTAASFASAIPGGTPMAWNSGVVTPAADDGFPGSKPIPQFTLGRTLGSVPNHVATGSIQVRFLLHVPVGGTVNGSSIVRINTTGGTAPLWVLSYGAGGTLTLTARDNEGVAIAGGVLGPIGFAVDGKFMYCSVELVNSGGNVSTRISTTDLLNNGFYFTSTGSVASIQVGRTSVLQMNYGLSMADVGFGHVSVETTITDLFIGVGGTNAMGGFNTEVPSGRLSRICAQIGVASQVSGRDATGGFTLDNESMGIQPVDTALNAIQQAVDVDGGVLFTPRDWLAVGFLQAATLLGQPADATLSYSHGDLTSLQPVEDDQNTRNDVTISRSTGSSARVVDSTSAMGVAAPPAGVGTYDENITLNVPDDSSLLNQAGWRVRLGTVNEARYPTIDINLARSEIYNNVTLLRQLLALDIGSRVVITNPPSWLPPDQISQFVQGYTEELSQFQRTLKLNCSPSVAYDTAGIFGISYLPERYSSDGSTLNGGVTSVAATLSVATATGFLWGHPDGDFDIIVAGERMTVTNVTGASSPQTFTVTRSVNGVVKTQTSGATVELFTPSYITL